MTITIERVHHGETTFREVFDLCLGEYREVGYVPINPEKLARTLYEIIDEGMTFLARDAEGRAIGTIGLIELGYWYSDETYLHDKFWFVVPDSRPTGAGLALMKAAKEEAQRRGKILFIGVKNPNRQSKNRTMMLESQDAGFVPFGYTMRMLDHGL